MRVSQKHFLSFSIKLPLGASPIVFFHPVPFAAYQCKDAIIVSKTSLFLLQWKFIVHVLFVMKPAYQKEKSERFQSVLVPSSTRKKVPLRLGDPSLFLSVEDVKILKRVTCRFSLVSDTHTHCIYLVVSEQLYCFKIFRSERPTCHASFPAFSAFSFACSSSFRCGSLLNSRYSRDSRSYIERFLSLSLGVQRAK